MRKISYEYKSLARSLYVRMRRTHKEIQTGKGAINNLASVLERIDRETVRENVREAKMGFTPETQDTETYTLKGLFYDFSQDTFSKKVYLDTLEEVYLGKVKGSEISVGYFDRLQSFMSANGKVGFDSKITGKHHTLNYYRRQLEKGKISKYTFNDLIEEYKHSESYNADKYKSYLVNF